MKNRVLLAVDASPASERAVDYLADWSQGRDVGVDVVHALPHADVGEAAWAGKQGHERAEQWLRLSREEAQPVVMRAVERLERDGVQRASIEDGILYLRPEASAADGLLSLARENGCATIVVGRNALPWHRELFHHHIADELIKKADGFTVWVVE